MWRIALCSIAAGALAACASGQKDQNIAAARPVAALAPAACPDLPRWDAPRLYGRWQLQLPDLGEQGTLVLRRHPEFGASLRGEFEIAGVRSIASGDLEEGEFNLDESRDGKSLFAFWSGRLVPEACGREIRGQMQQLDRPGRPGRESRFVLRRQGAAPGW